MTIIQFPGLEQSPDGEPIVGEGIEIAVHKVLDGAKNADLRKAIVLAETNSGNWYFATTHGNTPDLLHTIEIFKGVLLGYVQLEDSD